MSKSPKVIVFWSGAFDASNGQAIVTARVAAKQPALHWHMAIYPTKIWGVVGVVRAALILLYGLILARSRTIYLVCSRSTPGILRDLVALFPVLLGVRVVVHAHGSDLPKLLKRPVIGRLARMLYSHCEVIVPSAHLIEPLRALPCRKVHLVENFAVSTPARIPETTGGPFRILWNSNVLASKGFRELVEGARLARSQGLDLSLVILGQAIADEEASKASISAFLRPLSKEKWIDVRGSVSADVAAEAVVECDVVALPSHYASECQPLALIQAMCAGRKVIAADTPALRATLAGYPAHFCAREPHAISLALLAEAGSPKIEENIRAAAQTRFSEKRFDDDIESILIDPSL